MSSRRFSRAAAWLVAVLTLAATGVRGDCVDDAVAAQMKARYIPGVALAIIYSGSQLD